MISTKIKKTFYNEHHWSLCTITTKLMKSFYNEHLKLYRPKFKKLNFLVCNSIDIVAKYKLYFNIIMYIFLEFQMKLSNISFFFLLCPFTHDDISIYFYLLFDKSHELNLLASTFCVTPTLLHHRDTYLWCVRSHSNLHPTKHCKIFHNKLDFTNPPP